MAILPADGDALMRELQGVGEQILSQNAALKAEYDALLQVAARLRS